ncbi:ABC transporter substrate-binding protein [Methanogenium organophilum]|uniref:ABC transporter substrate-binding protein n=1 Tax=Methanogenium organophilum TaxID=2199 RepID=A0A9X9T8N7_METOG|nr:ABC transporter substrate-binding protein [Methanogenium organophilum]WAI02364.1 ABC transporter substrate-binding protein [Methanogenium organophilum]
MKKIALEYLPFIITGLICCFIFANAVINTPDYGENETIKIGIMVPLSGGLGEYGMDVKIGVDMAVDEINAKGGIGGKMVQAVYKNTWGHPERDATLMKECADEGIPVVIGDITSAGALACAEIAEDEGIVLISQAATTPELSGYGPYVFRTISSDTYQGRGMARIFQIFHPNADNITVLYIDNAYGTGLAEAFMHAKEEGGFTVQQSIPFEEGQRIFTHEITAIREADSDGIALIAHVTEANYILKEAEAQGLDVAWVGSDGIVTTEFYSHVGTYAEGFIATMQASEVQDPAFINEYRIRAKESTVNWMAPYSYDTMMVVAEAIEHGGYSADAIRSSLENIRHLGVCGPKVFEDNGDIPPAYDVMRVENGIWTRVSWKEITSETSLH